MAFNKNAEQAFVTLGEFLNEDGWYPQRMEGGYIYQLLFSGEHGNLVCYAVIHMDSEQFLFYAVAPLYVPEPLRLQAADFINRTNFGLWIGNFEMDPDDGEVRYKSSLDFEGTPLTRELIRNAIYPAVQTMNQYLPQLKAVILSAENFASSG